MDTKKICTICKKSKLIGRDFYASRSPDTKGKSNACKSCMNEMIDLNNMETVYEFFRMLDYPFLITLWNSVKSNKNGKPITDYMRSMNNPKNIQLRYKDSDFGLKKTHVLPEADKTNNKKLNKNDISSDDKSEKVFVYEEEDDDGLNEPFYITKDMKQRWYGFKKEEIPRLEYFFDDWRSNYEMNTPAQRNLYKNLSIAQMQAEKCITEERVGDYDKLMKTISSMMNDANVKPVQESGAEANGLSSLGEWIKKIEETEPCEEPREEFKDVDRIWFYINKFFVTPFLKIFGIKSDIEEDEVNLFDEVNGDLNGGA